MTEYGSGTYGGTVVTVEEEPVVRDLYPRAALGNIGMSRGDTVVRAIRVERNEIAEDLSADKLFFTAKRSSEDTDAEAVIKKSNVTAGIVVTSAAQGLAELTILPADTLGLSGLVVAVLVYDLQLVKPTGQVFTISEGTVIVQPDSSIATV